MNEQRSAYKSYTEQMIMNLLLNDPDQNIIRARVAKWVR